MTSHSSYMLAEAVVMLVLQISLNAFFNSNKFAYLLATRVKMLFLFRLEFFYLLKLKRKNSNGKLRQVKAWVERLKRPLKRMQRSFLMTQKDPSKGFHRDMISHSSLK